MRSTCYIGSNVNGTPGITCGVGGGGRHAAPRQHHGENIKPLESHWGRTAGSSREGARHQGSSPAAHLQGGCGDRAELNGFSASEGSGTPSAE